MYMIFVTTSIPFLGKASNITSNKPSGGFVPLEFG